METPRDTNGSQALRPPGQAKKIGNRGAVHDLSRRNDTPLVASAREMKVMSEVESQFSESSSFSWPLECRRAAQEFVHL